MISLRQRTGVDLGKVPDNEVSLLWASCHCLGKLEAPSTPAVRNLPVLSEGHTVL